MISTLLTTILAQENNGGSITSLLILVLPLGAVLYMAIMPQRKQRQKQAALLAKLDVGDEIITTGGIIGVITFVEEDLFHVEIDNDVVVRVAKSAVTRGLHEPAEPDKSKPASRSRKGLLAGALGGQGQNGSADAATATATDTDADASSESDSTSVDKK